MEVGGAATAAGLAAVALFKGAALGYLSRQHRARRETVATVTGLKLHPLKAAPALSTDALDCHLWGLSCSGAGDRQWVLVTGTGRAVNLTKEPRLVLAVLSLQDGHLHVDGPDMPTLRLPLAPPRGADVIKVNVYGQQLCGADCGAAAAAWFCRLLGQPSGTYRLAVSPAWLTPGRVTAGPSKHHKWADDEDQCLFQNVCAGTLMSTDSLRDLQRRLPPGVDVTADNFRPNIVIEGNLPYDEDEYEELAIGTAVFSKLKSTDRCPVTTVHPTTGQRNPNEEPLTTMKEYRMLEGYNRPCFCISLVVRKPGTVRLGDTVNVVRSSP